jgi:hypothetical protein
LLPFLGEIKTDSLGEGAKTYRTICTVIHVTWILVVK